MLSVEDVIAVRDEMYARSVDLIKKKGQDYNSQVSRDTLFNLRVAALLGVVDSPERGILVRLSDKFCRLISLISADKPNYESFEDTILDIHNYIDYIVALRREKAGNVPIANRLESNELSKLQELRRDQLTALNELRRNG